MTTLPPRRTPYFVAGGTLGPHIPSYVKRPADDELYEHVLAGEYCYVLTPRQMGKSSLVARTMVRLKDKQISAVNIDLQDSGGLDEDTFYLNILDELRRAFQLDADIEAWWDENGRLGASLRFRRFFTDHLLPQVNGRVVIFIDEIDTMLTMPFRDNFFATIRALYNGRAGNPELDRLTFVLLGVASPSELIKDPDRTPFNIGSKINLQEFEPTDADPLLEGLEQKHPQQAAAILERIFYWTSGHPYLTQQLCLRIAQASNHDWHNDAIDDLVRQTFLSDEARNEDNIKLIQSRISASPNKRQLLRLYRQAYRGEIVKENKSSAAQNQLLLSGLVSVADGHLQVRNRIYLNVFDRSWIRQETEINWGVVIGVMGGLVALLAILALLYNTVWLPNKQRNYELSFLQATSAEERAEAMSGLASIRPLPLIGDATVYEQSVRELFFGMDDWEEQKAIYDHQHFNENPDKLVRMIKIVYISMVDADGSGHTTGMLAHMADNLGNLEDEDVVVLQQEVSQWVQGRTLIENDDYKNALAAYNNAIAINPNNPATLFERARILTEIGNTSTDQTVSADNYSLALADLDRVVSFILLQPEPEVGEILPTSSATQPPTATNTATPITTAVSTFPVPIDATLESTVVLTPNATATVSTSLTATIAHPSQPTPIPRPLPPQFNTRSQWLNLIRDFLQSESALDNTLLVTENLDNAYPNLFNSGLISTPTVYTVRIEDADTSMPIQNARIFLFTDNMAFNDITDIDGFALFSIPTWINGKFSEIRVEADGYNSYSDVVDISLDSSVINLSPETAEAIIQTPPSLPLVDLVIGSPQLVSTPPIAAFEPVDFSIVITNTGDIDINQQFSVDLYLDPTDIFTNYIPTTQSDGFLIISNLPAGESRVITITASHGFENSPNIHLAYGMIDSTNGDSGGQIPESIETNNVSLPTLVGAPTPLPTPIATSTTDVSNLESITGIVQSSTTSLAPLARVRVSLINSNSLVVAITQTDLNGFYTFDNVPTDTYNITACMTIDGVEYFGLLTPITPPNLSANINMTPGVCDNG